MITKEQIEAMLQEAGGDFEYKGPQVLSNESVEGCLVINSWAAVDLCRLALQAIEAEKTMLKFSLNTPSHYSLHLDANDLKAAEAHCDWIAFKHAWNAVHNKRRSTEALKGEL